MTKMHSILPPSSAARRMACPGSRGLEAKHPRLDESDSAREGEIAHRVAVEYLIIGEIAFNLECTEDMKYGARLYREVLSEGADADLFTETLLDLSAIYPGAFGTPDAFYFKNDELYVVDYKFGFSPVEAFENWQLLSYAVGARAIAKTAVNKINLIIVQPRDYISSSRVKRWSITNEELNKYLFKLQENAALSMSPSAPCYVTPECGNCSARYACDTLRLAAANAIDASLENSSTVLTSAEIGHELNFLHRARDILNARIDGLEVQAISYLKEGALVHGYSLGSTSNRQVWKLSAEEIIEFGKVFNCDLKKPDDVITPNQALKKGIPEDILETLTERKAGAVKLLKSESIAKKIFKKSIDGNVSSV